MELPIKTVSISQCFLIHIDPTFQISTEAKWLAFRRLKTLTISRIISNSSGLTFRQPIIPLRDKTLVDWYRKISTRETYLRWTKK